MAESADTASRSTRSGRILVVEDEESIGQGLCDVLTFRGHRVTWSQDGASAVREGEAQNPDLILLDIMLPELDGFSVCEKLRAAGCRAGVIMLTAKGSEADILRGFEAGADDYVTKPFSLKQLLARVEAVLGRSLPEKHEEQPPFSLGSLVIDPSHAQAAGPEGKTEDLTARELGILRLLAEEPGRIVSRRTLLREVWEMPHPESVETRTVDVHVGKLRKKLARLSRDTIQSVRGQGYRYIRGEQA